MTNTKRVIIFAVFSFAICADDRTQPGEDFSWAFPIPDKNPPPAEHDTAPKQLAGSTKSYTQEQIDDQFNPPDWFPQEHPTPPQIVVRGIKPSVQACGSCHLMSGNGHPESASLAGLPVSYLMRQMADFKSGERKDPAAHTASQRSARMNGIAKAIYHFFFLSQPAPFPETLVGNSLDFFMGGGKSETQAEYLRCMKDPATLNAMCEDYRAAATIDLEHVRADLNRKIECPLLVLWAEQGSTSPAQRATIRPMGPRFDMLTVWRERAKHVRGKGLPGGHALQGCRR